MYFPFCIQKLIYSGSLGQKVEVFMFEANSTRKYVFFKENKFGIDVGAPIYIYLIMMTMKLGAQRNVGDWGEDGDEHQSALGLWGSYEVCVFISTFVGMCTVQVLPAFLRILREPTPISIRLSGSILSETWYRRKYLKMLFNIWLWGAGTQGLFPHDDGHLCIQVENVLIWAAWRCAGWSFKSWGIIPHFPAS